MVSEVQLKTRGSLRVTGVNGAIEGKEEGEASGYAVILRGSRAQSKSVYYTPKLRFSSLRNFCAKFSSPTRCKGHCRLPTAGGALLLRLDLGTVFPAQKNLGTGEKSRPSWELAPGPSPSLTLLPTVAHLLASPSHSLPFPWVSVSLLFTPKVHRVSQDCKSFMS